jgi:hypothetical protein
MKSPPVQYTDDEAHRLVQEFIAGQQLPDAPTPEADGQLATAD